MNYPYVYLGINKTTNEFYIGSRVANKNPAHLDLGFKYFTSSKFIDFELFDWYILVEFFRDSKNDDAYWFEQELIKESISNPLCLNKFYIDKEKGTKKFDRSGISYPLSDEHKQKISLSNKGKQTWLGKKHSEETKQKIAKSKIGLKYSEETKLKQSIARTGKTHSKETRLKLSKSGMGKTNGAKQIQIDSIMYDSIKIASEVLSISNYLISKRLKSDDFKNYVFV